jgi:hypothetical protein
VGCIPDKVIGFYFSIYLILFGSLLPSVNSASNRNECQNRFRAVKLAWRVRLSTLPPSVSRLSRKCLIVDVSKSCGPLQPTAIALLIVDAFRAHFIIHFIALVKTSDVFLTCCYIYIYIYIRNETPWYESASKIHQPIDCCLLAK